MCIYTYKNQIKSYSFYEELACLDCGRPIFLQGLIQDSIHSYKAMRKPKYQDYLSNQVWHSHGYLEVITLLAIYRYYTLLFPVA